MYSHHTRIYPKRDDVYSAEFPGPYYSTSSVYSYSPTSASDCPEHGRSRGRITVILTTSIVLATLGVLSIAGVAAYLGILSKNISNNASQSTVEESYLQGSDAGSGLGGLGIYSVVTTTEETAEIFTTNDDLLGGLDALDGMPGDSLLSGDLTKSRPSGSSGGSPKSSVVSVQPPPRRTIEGQYFPKMPPSFTGPSGNAGSVSRVNTMLDSNDMLSQAPVVTMAPPHDELKLSHGGHVEDNPVRMFTEPSQTSTVKSVTSRGHRQRYPMISSTTTTTSTTEAEEKMVRGEVIHLSHPENAKKPGEIESLLKEDHPRSSSTTSSTTTTTTATTTSGSSSTRSTSTLSTSTGSQIEEETETGNRRMDEDIEEDNSEDDNPSTEFDLSRLNGVSPTMISRLDQQQNPDLPFKPFTPIVSGETMEYGHGITSIPMMGLGASGGHKGGKLPLKFDKILPEYYDNQPWTPLLDRPNLDKRPRVEVDLGMKQPGDSNGVGDNPAFSSTEPIIVWNSDEPEEFGTSLEYPPRQGSYQNYSLRGTSPQAPEGGLYGDIIYGPGANFTVSTYYGYGHGDQKKDAKPGVVLDESVDYTGIMDNPVYPPEEEEPVRNKYPPVPPQHPVQHQNEEAMSGFRPSNLPAYTIMIPHIPNPDLENGSKPGAEIIPEISGAPSDRDFVRGHLSPPEDYAAGSSKMDRMGVAAAAEEDNNEPEPVKDNPKEDKQPEVSYNFEAIKTIPVPEEPAESLVKAHSHEDDYLEDADIDEFTESETEGEPKIYRLDPDSVKDLVPDTLGAAVTNSRPTTTSASTTSTKKSEDTPRSSTSSAANIDAEDVATATYVVDDSFELKQNELARHPANKTNLTPPAKPNATSGKDFDKEFSPASMELVIGPQEPDLLIQSTTDLIMSTLGSLNLIKTPAKPPPTEEEISHKLRNSDIVKPEPPVDTKNSSIPPTGSDPLFPPVRSYVGVNQPLRPKPNKTGDPLASNHLNKQLRFSEDHPSGTGNLDPATTHSLQKVLSMMLANVEASATGPDESRHLSSHPLIKSLLNKQNVTLVVANETGPPKVILLQDMLPTVMPTMRQTPGPVPTTPSSVPGSHRDPKAFITSGSHFRESKIDHAQFTTSGEVNHVPVPLILNSHEAPQPSAPSIPAHLTAFPWSSRPPKISKVHHQNNSPVYKFVLKKGQSVEDLLKEIFSNYTTEPHPASQITHSTAPEQVPVKLGMIANPNNPAVQGHPGYLKSLEVESTSGKPVRISHHVETTPVAPLSQEPETFTSTSVVVQSGSGEDLGEASFEVGGGCGGNDTFKCLSSGKCLPSYLRCNFITECEDASDERGCLCADFLRANGNARKLCDGIPDCADASDEYLDCEYCQPGQYICAGTRTCINKEQICDSRRDCQYGDDESDCVKIGGDSRAPETGLMEVNSLKEDFSPTYHKQGQLMVRKTGVWGKLCVESFSSVVSHWEVKDLARAVCKALTFSDYERVEKIEDPQGANSTEPYYELHYNNELQRNHSASQKESSGEQHQRPSGLGFRETECKSRLVMNVTCQDLQCGVAPRAYTQRARYRVTRIVGGANSLPGKWPWQAALYKNGEYQCGATLISSRWLLSAGHCFYHAQDDYWVARLGTLRRGATVLSPYEQVVRITHIFLHPEYKDVGFINDVSLLRLEKEVNFTDFVRPVCLPGKESRIRDGRMCTVVGWGQLFEVGRVFPDTLQEVQLPLISTQECRKRTLFLPLYKLTEQMFCAGFERGGRDACLGDSGGPLMCPESDGRWSLYGVTSNGYGCARANRPGVYTKVTSYLDWIYEKMGQDSAFTYRDKSKACPGHRCLLGECLDKRQVCNGIRDCIEDDGSDERGPNCTAHLSPGALLNT